MIRKAAQQIGIPGLLIFIALNAFFAVNHLKQTQKTADLTLESSTIQAQISGVLKDLTDMETGQRGYLLTANRQYLQPYTEAKVKIDADLARLESALASHPQDERSKAAQLKSLVNSKQAEMERSIKLREQNYRLRAFRLVDTNEGMKYMDSLREILSSLSAAESQRFAKLDSDRNAALKKALKQTLATNLGLLLFTAFLFGLIRFLGRDLEKEAAVSRQGLLVRDLQLDKLTSALSNQARSNTSSIEVNASLLLQNYGGFLPRQGHEYAEQIKEASAQMERLRQDLVACREIGVDEKAA
jgi:CHASE3 domain sensor protein